MYKKVNMVMLPTNEKANECPILYFPKTKRLNKRAYSDEELQAGNGLIQLEYSTNHLYITSNDEIKEGDYCIDGDEVFGPYEKQDIAVIGFKKIIATTDSSLVYNRKQLFENNLLNKNEQSFYKNLPQIPQQFTEHYVSEYNKGNIITKVMVKFVQSSDSFYGIHCPIEVKVSKDNTINIKPVKDSWTREEVVNLLNKLNEQINIVNKVKYANEITLEQWIEQNL